MLKKKDFIFFIILIILVIALVVSIETAGFSNNPFSKPSESLAVKRAIEFVKTQVPPKTKVELKEATYQSGLYHIKFSVEEKEFEAYVDKKGELLFPSVISLKKELEKRKIVKTDRPEVKLFTMAFCPFGNQAEEAIKPAIDLLEKFIDFEPHYVIYSNYGRPLEDFCLTKKGEYCSMHGNQELHQDIRELCLFKYQKDKYWQFVEEVNRECKPNDVDECWLGIAKKLGIDSEKISNCLKNEAVALLKQEVELNKKFEVTGSPTLIINGKPYQGKRTPDAYKEAICQAFKNPPSECQKKLSQLGKGIQGNCQ